MILHKLIEIKSYYNIQPRTIDHDDYLQKYK